MVFEPICWTTGWRRSRERDTKMSTEAQKVGIGINDELLRDFTKIIDP
jgi:hypothetical protein